MKQPDRKKYSNVYLNEIEEKLHTAAICDILDELGYRDQVMNGAIAPLREEYSLIGFAKTMLCHDVYEIPGCPYETEIEAVDTITPGDVVVVCTNHSQNNGFWGVLMAEAAIARGGRGVVLEGAVRDIRQLKRMEHQFQVFAAGRNPLDSKGRCTVAAYDCPISCGGAAVRPGDMVFGDIDGVVVIPQEVAEEVLDKAMAKIREENNVRADLRGGMLLKDAFAKHGLL